MSLNPKQWVFHFFGAMQELRVHLATRGKGDENLNSQKRIVLIALLAAVLAANIFLAFVKVRSVQA
jgi:hypothetical protein